MSTSPHPDAQKLAEAGKDGPDLTPDGRYIIVRGRLWRAANPHLPEARRDKLIGELMDARRDVGTALRSADKDLEKDARARVHQAKLALGERGPVWWSDGAPDENRKLVHNSTYADWWARRDKAKQG